MGRARERAIRCLRFESEKEVVTGLVPAHAGGLKVHEEFAKSVSPGDTEFGQIAEIDFAWVEGLAARAAAHDGAAERGGSSGDEVGEG